MALRELVAAALVGLPFGIGATVSTADPPSPLFRFADPEIVESSGLVVQDGLVVTTNDSGDEARVFSVDPATGATVGVTRWPDEPVDVEALAPAGPGEVWVGDIGDNTRRRESVRVTRVPVGRGERVADAAVGHDLTYPDGASDAEALLAHPGSGRLYVVTKGVLGGRLYAAPADLAGPGPHRLRLLGEVTGLVTDGAFFPDGRHVVLRDYTRALVLGFPELKVVGEVPLPDTRQGEGIAVAPDGRVLVSSEGVRAPVHEVELPRHVVRAMARPGGGPSPSAGPTETSPSATAAPRPAPGPADEPPGPEPWPWLLTGVAGIVVVAVLLRSLRPH